jgi:hypothetical protein
MARKLVGVCVGMLLFGSPAFAQDVPPESFPIDISEHSTDPFWTGACDPGMMIAPSLEAQMMLCWQQLTAPAPSSVVAPPAPSGPVTPAAPAPRLMSPFPIVRLAGRVTRGGTRIQVLQVWAPRGARALIRCRGRGCPLRRAAKSVRKTPLRVRAVERVVPPGVLLEVLVRQGDSIGKFTRFRFRDYRRPLRRDGCLWPGTIRLAACPG